MGKLTGCLGACVMMLSLNHAIAQDPIPEDPFGSFEESSASETIEAAGEQIEPEPIIQAPPAMQRPAAYSRHLLTSRPKNTHVRQPVRSARTPAQELIYQRERFQAQQRLSRMEFRKWQGKSGLRPHYPQSNHSGVDWTEHPADWWHAYQTPVWHAR